MGLFKGEYDELSKSYSEAEIQWCRDNNKRRENRKMNIIWVNFGWGGFVGEELESNMTVYYTKNVKKINNPFSICNCGECKKCATNGKDTTIYRKGFKNVKSKNSSLTNSWEISDEIRKTFYEVFFELLLEYKYSDNIFITDKNVVFTIDISVQELIDEFEIAIRKKYDFMVENAKPEKTTHFPMQIDQNTCDKINEWFLTKK